MHLEELLTHRIALDAMGDFGIQPIHRFIAEPDLLYKEIELNRDGAALFFAYRNPSCRLPDELRDIVRSRSIPALA